MKLVDWKDVEPLVREREKVTEAIEGAKNGYEVVTFNKPSREAVKVNGAWDKGAGHDSELELVAKIKHDLMWYRNQIDEKLKELGVVVS